METTRTVALAAIRALVRNYRQTAKEGYLYAALHRLAELGYPNADRLRWAQPLPHKPPPPNPFVMLQH